MAEPKTKRRFILKQQKFPILESLYKLNLAFQSLAFEIEALDDQEAVPLETLQLYRAVAEELRSAINHRVTEVLHSIEERDWLHYGKLRMKIENKLKE